MWIYLSSQVRILLLKDQRQESVLLFSWLPDVLYVPEKLIRVSNQKRERETERERERETERERERQREIHWSFWKIKRESSTIWKIEI